MFQLGFPTLLQRSWRGYILYLLEIWEQFKISRWLKSHHIARINFLIWGKFLFLSSIRLFSKNFSQVAYKVTPPRGDTAAEDLQEARTHQRWARIWWIATAPRSDAFPSQTSPKATQSVSLGDYTLEMKLLRRERFNQGHTFCFLRLCDFSHARAALLSGDYWWALMRCVRSRWPSGLVGECLCVAIPAWLGRLRRRLHLPQQDSAGNKPSRDPAGAPGGPSRPSSLTKTHTAKE